VPAKRGRPAKHARVPATPTHGAGGVLHALLRGTAVERALLGDLDAAERLAAAVDAIARAGGRVRPPPAAAPPAMAPVSTPLCARRTALLHRAPAPPGPPSDVLAAALALLRAPDAARALAQDIADVVAAGGAVDAETAPADAPAPPAPPGELRILVFGTRDARTHTITAVMLAPETGVTVVLAEPEDAVCRALGLPCPLRDPQLPGSHLASLVALAYLRHVRRRGVILVPPRHAAVCARRSPRASIESVLARRLSAMPADARPRFEAAPATPPELIEFQRRGQFAATPPPDGLPATWWHN